jgi:hypothetical protein
MDTLSPLMLSDVCFYFSSTSTASSSTESTLISLLGLFFLLKATKYASLDSYQINKQSVNNVENDTHTPRRFGLLSVNSPKYLPQFSLEGFILSALVEFTDKMTSDP